MPAQLAAAETAIKLNDAPAGILRIAGESQKLLHVALAAVDHHGDLVIVGQAALVVHPGLLVADAFAGIESLGLGYGLLAVSGQRGGGQAQRVLGVRLVQRTEQQGQAGGIVDIPAQTQVGHVAAGFAVVAVTVGFESGNVGGDIEVAILRAVLQAFSPESVAADAAAAAQGRVVAAFAAEALNDAARGVAEQAAERATQHFDALQVIEIE